MPRWDFSQRELFYVRNSLRTKQRKKCQFDWLYSRMEWLSLRLLRVEIHTNEHGIHWKLASKPPARTHVGFVFFYPQGICSGFLALLVFLCVCVPNCDWLSTKNWTSMANCFPWHILSTHTHLPRAWEKRSSGNQSLCILCTYRKFLHR